MNSKQILWYVGFLIVLLIVAVLLSGGNMLENPDRNTSVTDSWQQYVDPEIGFEISYPSEMQVEEVEMDGINFSMWGPTQVANTEFFDGISLTIREIDTSNFQSLRSFVENKMNEQFVNPIESHPTRREIAEREAWTFKAVGEINIESTYVYVRKSDSTALEIIYTAPDPEEQGFQETVDTMLSSLRVI